MIRSRKKLLYQRLKLSPNLFPMTAISSSLIRHLYTPPFISTVVRRFSSTVQHLSSLSPSLTSADKFHLSPADKLQLMPNQAIGKVATVYSNLMRVVVEQEKSPEYIERVELLCVVRGLLKNIEKKVIVGDKVLVGSIDWIDRRGRIDNVFDRVTELHHPTVANVDHLLVLFSLDQPKLEGFLLTMFLVEAESTGIPVTLALNKAELVDKETIMSWKSKLSSWGYEPIFCSVVTKAGLGPLYAKLRDRTSVILGPSGVGKSSLINALRSNNFFFPPPTNSNLGSKWLEGQRVGEVSAKSGNGKHTTCHVSLLPLFGGGYVADTPGFSDPKKLKLLKLTQQSLGLCFPEIRNVLSASEPLQCAYRYCLHIGEPGCLVETDWERHFYYYMLLDMIKNEEENPRTREGDG
ncbi:small ribosomal subunit biogenesis GTPase RsgA 1, mitochondrial-like isoform X2 [Rutidosis leptorrhynchoides]|uniref:small ribosomal subunit biogenesis GTPase RsgA 1, mitochondrial-like isoform X2 n=1 Tax=Rutidosis leptorrhynchoides TaxID=125765 RepID=UPI003A99F7FE